MRYRDERLFWLSANKRSTSVVSIDSFMCGQVWCTDTVLATCVTFAVVRAVTPLCHASCSICGDAKLCRSNFLKCSLKEERRDDRSMLPKRPFLRGKIKWKVRKVRALNINRQENFAFVGRKHLDPELGIFH